MKDPFELDGKDGWFDPFADDPFAESAPAKEQTAQQTDVFFDFGTAAEQDPNAAAQVSEAAKPEPPVTDFAKVVVDEQKKKRLMEVYDELLANGTIKKADYEEKKREMRNPNVTIRIPPRPPRKVAPKPENQSAPQPAPQSQPKPSSPSYSSPSAADQLRPKR